MKIGPKGKKWIKRILWFLALRFIIGGILFYVIEYRFKDIMQVVIKKETHGAYAFDASSIDVELFKKNIVMNNAVLYCKDTSNAATHHHIEISKIYLSVKSWTDMLIHQKVSVDSMSITLPKLITRTTPPDHPEIKESKEFHASKILAILKKALSHLEVRTLAIEGAAFKYHNKKMPEVFSSNKIHFHIKNFSQVQNKPHHLFATDDIDISVAKQNWKFPDGLHEFSFSKLHFSGKSESFELDSCHFRGKNKETGNTVSLKMDKLYIRSTQLNEVYDSEKLMIDTIICYRPVLRIQTYGKKKTEAIDTTVMLQSITKLFKGVNIKYISVVESQFFLNGKTQNKANYASEKTNLKIYNLSVNTIGKTHVTTDSIKLDLEKMKFVTKDNMFQMIVGKFTIEKNDIVFKEAEFGPTPENTKDNKFTFSSSSLRLRDVNIEDLLNKKITAKAAELDNPIITVQVKKKPKADSGAFNLNRFYDALSGLKSLVGVEYFKVKNGTLNYVSTANATNLSMHMKQFNLTIAMQDFVKSDSLFDIKKSITEFYVGDINVQSTKLKLHLKDYVLNGNKQVNNIRQFHLNLMNGTEITGSNIFFKKLDWDQLQKSKSIKIDSASVNKLTIHILKKEEGVAHQKKSPPTIDINSINIKQLSFTLVTPGITDITCTGQNIYAKKLKAVNTHFEWEQAGGLLKHISFENKDLVASVETLQLNTSSESIMHRVNFATKTNSNPIKVIIPTIKLQADLNSSKIDQLTIYSLVIDHPEIMMTNMDSSNQPKRKPLPFDIIANKLKINHAIINYTKKIIDKGTQEFSGDVSFEAEKLKIHKAGNVFVTFHKTEVDVSTLKFNTESTHLALSGTNLILKNGTITKTENGSLSAKSDVAVNFREAAIKYAKWDSLNLDVDDLSGNFHTNDFTFAKGEKINWAPLIYQLNIEQGNIALKNKTFSIKINQLNWDPKHKTANLGSYSYTPNKSMEETFAQQDWQKAYLTVQGKAIQATGVDFMKTGEESSLKVHKVVLSNMELTSSKDKRKAFKHGEEKPMLTKLINGIKLPLHVDSVQLKDSRVLVQLISPRTNKMGEIPIDNMNMIVTNIKNKATISDSLHITGSARLYNNYIRNLSYHESYTDSLSYFRMNINVSPITLNEFNSTANHLASVVIKKGNSDTLFANWRGNKYAAVGKMNFYYKNLDVEFLDKHDSTRKKLILNLENDLVNALLKNNNQKESLIFAERDPEKVVFNYWVKANMSGVLTSTGVKSNRKYRKAHKKFKKKYNITA